MISGAAARRYARALFSLAGEENLLSVTLSLSILGGRSSGVERNLAKVEVVSSNLIARSIILEGTRNCVSRLRLVSSAP